MIINRSALDRGFAHATLIKTETVDLREGAGRGAAAGSKARTHTPSPSSLLLRAIHRCTWLQHAKRQLKG